MSQCGRSAAGLVWDPAPTRRMLFSVGSLQGKQSLARLVVCAGVTVMFGLWPAPCAGEAPPAGQQTTAESPPLTVDGLKQGELAVAQRLLKDFPNTTDPLALLGNVYNRQGSAAEAVKCWEQCLERNPNRADAYDGLALVAKRKAEYEKAVALWQKAVALSPKAPEFHDHLAEGLMSLGRTKEAIAALEQEIAISPRASVSFARLGQACLQVGDFQRAKKAYTTAIEIQPDLARAYYGLATACGRLGEQDKAAAYRREYQRLTAADMEKQRGRRGVEYDVASVAEGVAKTYTEAGRVYRGRGFLLRAEQHFRRAAELAPKNTDCRTELISLYQANRQEKEALEVCKQLREIDPRNAYYCMTAGLLGFRLQQFEVAEEAFRKAAELAPQRPEAYRALTQLRLHTGSNLAEAKTWAAKAVELAPIAANYALLSEACQRNADRAGAIAAIRRALELEPGNGEYRRVYEAMKNRE